MDINIAVTGINATDNPGPGSGIIRSIRYSSEFKGKIIGLAYDAMDPGIYQKDLVDAAYMIPYPSQDPSILLERIKEIHKKESIDLLIPTLDAEILNFIKIEDDLNQLGIKTFLPHKESFKLRSKETLIQLCKDAGINTPKTIIISSPEELYKSDIEYPVFVKGLFYDAYKAFSFAEAAEAFYKISSKWGIPVIIQEFIKGEEFDIVALGDGKENTVGAVAMKKMSLTDKNKAWAGVSINNKNLIDLTQKLIKHLKWKGAVETEFIYNSEKDSYYLIEINPRFPAWCYLSAGAGQNLPFALVKMALNQKIEPFSSYESGIMFIRYSSEVLSNIKNFEKLITYGYLKD